MIDISLIINIALGVIIAILAITLFGMWGRRG